MTSHRKTEHQLARFAADPAAGRRGSGGRRIAAGGLTDAALAVGDHPPIGTWPAGSSGQLGLHRRRRAAHRHLRGAGRGRAQGLAARRRAHQRRPSTLIKKISPKTTKGVLGKEVKLVVADSAAKPNDAVQAQQRFINENKVDR